MAELVEKVVFEINVDSHLEQLRQLNIQINQAKQNQKDLREQAIKGDKAAGEELERVNVFLKAQQKEYAATQRLVVGFTVAQKENVNTINFLNNSVKTNRALLAQLTEQYNNMRSPSKELIATIKKLSDTLKEQEGAIGDTRRNVGNYTESILDAVGGLNLFGTNLGAVVNPLKNVGGAVNGLREGTLSLGAAFATTGLPLIIAGFSSLTESLKVYKSISDDVEDATSGLANAFKFIIPIFGNLNNNLSEQIDLFSDAYDKGVKYAQVQREIAILAARNNYENELDNVQIQQKLLASRDRNKSEEDRIRLLKEAIDLQKKSTQSDRDLLDKQIDIAKEKLADIIKQTGEGNDELVILLNELNAKEAKIIADNISFEERKQKQINALIKEGIDREVSLFDKREAILTSSGQATASKLIEIEKGRNAAITRDASLTGDEIALINRQSAIKILKIQQDFTNRLAEARVKARQTEVAEAQAGGKDVTEQLVKVEQEQAKILLNNILLNKQERLNIENESIENIRKIRRDGAQKIFTDSIAQEQLEVSRLKNIGVDTTDLEVAIEEEKGRKILEALVKGSVAYINQVEKTRQAVAAILKADTTKRVTDLLKGEDLIVQGLKDSYDRQVKEGLLFGEKQIDALKDLTDTQVAAEQDRADFLLSNTALTEQERFNIIQESENKIKNLKAGSAQTQFEISKKLAQNEVEAASISSEAIVGFIGTVAEASGAGAEFQKALAFVDILTKQAIAIANAVVAATASGAATGPAAIVTTPVFIATLVSSVLAAFGGLVSLVAGANVPSTPKFAQGGAIDIDGRSHSQGGTPIHVNGKLVAEAEAGEKMFILKKEASAHINSLSALNQMFGGRSFSASPVAFAAQGGQVSASSLQDISFNDGGFLSRAIQRQTDLNQLESILTNAIKNLPAPVVGVKEITRVQNGLDRSTRISEAG